MADNKKATDSNIDFVEEMRNSYAEYASSVIRSRALYDVRDGLKPVHRRILYAMHAMGLVPPKPVKKSARVVGDVLGKYHPHGDTAVYDAMVRMAQSFSMRLPLVEGQGNFGSVDGDSPAAMRYTEVRLASVASDLVGEIGEGTVPFVPNYDGSEKEPALFAARFPQLLANGGAGVAVGFASNIPSFNLGRLIDAASFLIGKTDLSTPERRQTIDRLSDKQKERQKDLSEEDFTKMLTADEKKVIEWEKEFLSILGSPDFPLGCIVGPEASVRASLRIGSGRGSFEVLADCDIVDPASRTPSSKAPKGGALSAAALMLQKKNKTSREGLSLVFKSLPPGVSKSTVIAQIASLAGEGKIPGVIAVRDESGEDIRIVVELVPTASASAAKEIRDLLYKKTGLGELFHVNMTVLRDGAPATLSAIEIVREWAVFRQQCVRSRTEYRLGRAKHALEIQEGLLRAILDIDKVIAIVRAADTADEAAASLVAKLKITETQARAILEYKLSRLTKTSKIEVEKKIAELKAEILSLETLLSSENNIRKEIISELKAITKLHATAERTKAFPEGFSPVLSKAGPQATGESSAPSRQASQMPSALDALKERKNVYVAMSPEGKLRMYQRQPVSLDGIRHIVRAQDPGVVLVLSSLGRAYPISVDKLSEKAKSLSELAKIEDGDEAVCLIKAPEPGEHGAHVLIATRSGSIKRLDAAEAVSNRQAGIPVVSLESGDSVVSATSLGSKEGADVATIWLQTTGGFIVSFSGAEVPLQGRSSRGVRGIAFKKPGDSVSVMVVTNNKALPGVVDKDSLKAALPTADQARVLESAPGRAAKGTQAKFSIRNPVDVRPAGTGSPTAAEEPKPGETLEQAATGLKRFIFD